MESEKKKTGLSRLATWFDLRLGLSYPMLRPAPQYSINPFYWLGALTVVAFVIQGVTGVIMMLYYIPSPTQAYSTTQYIFQNVPYGRFLETIHLYTAYAMIVLAFMHMMRGYFVSVYKKPREVMWVVGMLIEVLEVSFGFTGYLLPWTVVSKSATDVGMGMISALPPQVSSFLTFLIVGSGGDAAQLLRFYDLHVVLLPAVLLVLLALKMYMLESHGISEPSTGTELQQQDKKLIPIFPDVTMYLVELAMLFGIGMLLISAFFPLNLPPEYSAAAAANFTPQPDWYFLWIYQILKVSIFEGGLGLPIALSVITAIMLVLVILPFIDRGETRNISKRPIFVTLGAIFVTEVAVLAYWGLVTPGKIIPAEQAAFILGGTALIVALVSTALFRLLSRGTRQHLHSVKSGLQNSTALFTGTVFAGLVALGALSIGSAINSATELVLQGLNAKLAIYFTASLLGIALVALSTSYLIYRLDLGTHLTKRKVKLFEIGWEESN
ncbi:MAG: cytochrome bc complex cytochrome b subunit [Thaumarchaeota archaeon]|nr:cytochrome bc complex cytochrome b subunit [Nitrososphaerota archaeon]